MGSHNSKGSGDVANNERGEIPGQDSTDETSYDIDPVTKRRIINITVISDITSHICYIHKYKLDKVMKELENSENWTFSVAWEPFILSCVGQKKPLPSWEMWNESEMNQNMIEEGVREGAWYHHLLIPLSGLVKS